MKKVILTLAFSAATIFATAQTKNNTISLTWQGSTNKEFILYAGLTPFTIDWGDGTITDTIGYSPGGGLRITYSYADTTRNYNVTFTGNRDTTFVHLHFQAQQVSSIDVSRCPGLLTIDCRDNRLPLSELYKISEKLIHQSGKGLGTQRLLPQRILVGSSVDYSDQNEFGGIFTNYNLIKNSRTIYNNDD